MIKWFAKVHWLLATAAVLSLLVGMWLVLAAPQDYQQGNAVRILYVHVPAAKMALLSYVVLTIASALYLWRRKEMWDILAEAAVSVGAAFTALTLASGSIWGKPMWGAWWAWDARLTSMLVLLILFMGLMALRNALDDPHKSARATAVLALIGAADLPIIHFSVVWWRTLHQPPSFDGPAKQTITGELLPPLFVMSLAFFLLGMWLLVLKSREIAARRQWEAVETERLERNHA
ncbi:heme ABC transporter permease CcmC [Candidatus Magnetaquicoccus inordinatus]|uniref:heme ABC transporter permease CcmC n=1 Tax=Candidatus Magnetaquicoccus inordinatus TaxID=2496818 RepID=UPI00102B404B|nr:heme ABC transporter permease CcmC [Candidatus Magnetaquicoccus inordinatus]